MRYEVKPNPPQPTLGGRTPLFHTIAAAKSHCGRYKHGAKVIDLSSGQVVYTHYVWNRWA